MIRLKYDMKDCITPQMGIESEIVIASPSPVEQPFFSVVIPTYKRPEYIKECVTSVISQKGFDEPYEIIVVDNDAAKENLGTERILREMNLPNLTYYRNTTNLGACGNWNRCVMLAKSQWVIMCHDDDLLKPNCLKTMKSILDKWGQRREEIGYIRASAESMYADNLIIDAGRRRDKKFRINKKMNATIEMTYMNVKLSGGATWAGAPTCGTMINKKAFIYVGGYNQELSPCPDCYVPYHMLGKYKVLKTIISTGKYRWEANDTYRRTTLINLISAYNEFLIEVSRKDQFARFFIKENYADCVQYYRSKAAEAGLVLSDNDIDQIRPYQYSKMKLKSLLLARKIYHVIQILKA